MILPAQPPTPKQPIPQQPPLSVPTNSHGQQPRRGKRHRTKNKFLTEVYAINAFLNETTGLLEEYIHLIKGKQAKHWMRGNTKEIVRLFQGRKDGSYKGTNTIVFCTLIQYEKVANQRTSES